MSTDASTRLSPPEVITGAQLREYVAFAADLLKANIDVINSLNVFPVPDGDTGTNMFLTMDGVVKALEAPGVRSAGDAAAVMSRAAMMEARGNSGIILSQFFKGLSVGLDGSEALGTSEMANALAEARTASYKAVADPVEGTMLTVIDWMARAAADAEESGESLAGMLARIGSAAEDAVANTPTMLSVLRDAGVVDAGGQGLAVIFEGLRRAHAGEATGPADAEVLDVPDPIGVDHALGTVHETFLASAEHEEFGYCVQFVVEGDGLDVDSIRLQIMEVSQSTVVVGDLETIKVHGHAEDPGPMISAAVVHGQLSRVSMQNMDEQHVEFAASHRGDRPAEGGVEDGKGAASVVSVAWGDGLEELFIGLGASGTLAAGDTMNPSVSQVLDAVNAAPSDVVVFLPNNKNIIPAARQAAEVSSKTLHVLPTRTIPQGVAALLAYNPERDVDETVAEMAEALQAVSSGEVTTAQRTVRLDGVEAQEGQTIGMLNGALVAAGDGEARVLADLLRTASVEDELVTLYWGGNLDESAAAVAASAVESEFPEAEVELVYGGQPHYHFLVSIEK